jgi:hypothetical protein
MSMRIKLLRPGALLLMSLALPAAAQFASPGYSFLRPCASATAPRRPSCCSSPVPTVVNYPRRQGRGALHIVAARRDLHLAALSDRQKGADVNLANRKAATRR